MNTAHKAKKAQTRRASRARVSSVEELPPTVGRVFTPGIRLSSSKPNFYNTEIPVSPEEQRRINVRRIEEERRERVRQKRLHYIPKHLTPNWEFPKGPAKTPPSPYSKRTLKRLARKQLGYARTGELVRVS